MLYWFATLVDAERIRGEESYVRFLGEAAIHAAGFAAPEVIHRAREDAIARLRNMPRLDEDLLIAYALQRQREVRGDPVS